MLAILFSSLFAAMGDNSLAYKTTVAFLLGWRPSLSEGTLHAEARSLKFLRSDYRESSDPFAGARHIDYLGYSEKNWSRQYVRSRFRNRGQTYNIEIPKVKFFGCIFTVLKLSY